MSDEYDEESDSYKPPNQREVPERRVPRYPPPETLGKIADGLGIEAVERVLKMNDTLKPRTGTPVTDGLRAWLKNATPEEVQQFADGGNALAAGLRAASEASVKSTYTVDSLATLIARVQDRGALYHSGGMNPVAAEELLDEVFLALREFQAIVSLSDRDDPES